MEDSILISTKQLLGLAADYDAFDPEITIHINSVFSVLYQLGIGPPGFSIEDDADLWSDFLPTGNVLSMVRNYMGLKVKSQFDPQTTSFGITASKEQIDELENRLVLANELTTLL